MSNLSLHALVGLLVLTATTTCSQAPLMAAGGREPASAERVNGGLSHSETELCSDYDCQYFIAPCALPDRNRSQVVISGMDELYLNQIENYTERRYCPQVPRTLASEQYAPGTCLFLFVKKDSCGN